MDRPGKPPRAGPTARGRLGVAIGPALPYACSVFGLLNVNKPAGPTSHDVVDGVRRRLPRGVKVGHAGTLDPFARGVLVICLGPATRLARYVQRRPKRYSAEVTLGAVSTTDDPQGKIVPGDGVKRPGQSEVREVLERFRGRIQQVPPAHSAVHVEGKRAYKLARQGKQPSLSPREVIIHDLQLVSYAYPRLTLDVRCGSGTYIRALARDIGRALEVGAYCSALTRTQVGPFSLAEAVGLSEIDVWRDLLSPLAALEDLPKVTLPSEAAGRIITGRPVALRQDVSIPTGGTAELAVLDEHGQLLAIAVLAGGGQIRPTKVFPVN